MQEIIYIYILQYINYSEYISKPHRTYFETALNRYKIALNIYQKRIEYNSQSAPRVCVEYIN